MHKICTARKLMRFYNMHFKYFCSSLSCFKIRTTLISWIYFIFFSLVKNYVQAQHLGPQSTFSVKIKLKNKTKQQTIKSFVIFVYICTFLSHVQLKEIFLKFVTNWSRLVCMHKSDFAFLYPPTMSATSDS